MGDRSKIEWTDATWNPVTGCSKITGSPGCSNCYAATFTERWRGTRGHYFARGFDVQEREDKVDLPLRWKRPRRVFVNSLSDIGHKAVSEGFLVEVFAVMALASQHTFLILTKRPGRVRSLLSQVDLADPSAFAGRVAARVAEREGPLIEWPLPNVWLGTSAENQAWAGVRVPVLLSTPAAVRFVSAEPLLGPLDLSAWLGSGPGRLQWVIAGGESGHGARPMHPAWPRALREQCAVAGAAFFFKQWGGWRLVAEDGADPVPHAAAVGLPGGRPCHQVREDGAVEPDPDVRGVGIASMMRVQMSVAGRELDGRTWDETPPLAAGATVRAAR